MELEAGPKLQPKKPKAALAKSEGPFLEAPTEREVGRQGAENKLI